ncbi:MAG: TonB family protein [Bacteroidales bacterium]|nr:TonB family protein [Bacteroidales bacterium]
MRLFILTNLLCSFFFVNGQEKVYYDAEGNSTKDISMATTYTIVEKSTVGKDSLFKTTDYYLTGQKKMEQSFLNEYKKGRIVSQKMVGEKWEWFENGDIRLKAFYTDGQLNGDFCTYWPNGKQRRKDVFEKGELTDGNCYDSLGVKLNTYFPYETMPMFPGGDSKLMQYIGTSIRYPVSAAERCIQGRVIIQFYVEKDGSISDIRIVRKLDPALDLEAFRVVNSMPNWIPGKLEGENVRVKFTLPINFRLQ